MIKEGNFEKMNNQESKAEEEKITGTIEDLRKKIFIRFPQDESIDITRKDSDILVGEIIEKLDDWDGDEEAKKEVLEEFESIREDFENFEDVEVRLKMRSSIEKTRELLSGGKLVPENYLKEGQEMTEEIKSLFINLNNTRDELDAGVDPERAKELLEQLEGLKTEKEIEEEPMEEFDDFAETLMTDISATEEELKSATTQKETKELKRKIEAAKEQHDEMSERKEIEELIEEEEYTIFKEGEITIVPMALMEVNILIAEAQKQADLEAESADIDKK